MGTAVMITRTEHPASERRAIAGKCRDGAQVRRLLALAMVLEGCTRTEASEQNGMDRQTLRDWVHRYNKAGVQGLKWRRSPVPSRPYANRLCALVWESYEAIVEACNPASHFFANDPDRIRSIGTREWACVSL